MFVPEYSITPKALRHIAVTEYAKALFDNITVLPQWIEKLKREAQTNTIENLLIVGKNTLPHDEIKRIIDGVKTNSVQEIKNLEAAQEFIDENSQNEDFEEVDFKYINKILGRNLYPQTKLGSYRTTKIRNKIEPEEVLAQTVQVFDWLNGLDARETHPIIKAAVFKAKMENIVPFEALNSETIDFAIRRILKSDRYAFGDLLELERYFINSPSEYRAELETVLEDEDEDYTSFIEFFCEGFSLNASNIAEKIKLLAKDTKVAKATGRVKVTKRQEKIVEYLQDYGVLSNKDFPNIFPNISEDTVLRDLKKLIDMGIVVKLGSTKSSRYELK
jgi:Fic family protein